MKYALAFLGAAFVDYVWAWYIQAAAYGAALHAAIASVIIAAVGGYLTITLVNDHWTLLAMLAGYFIGTWLKVSGWFNRE